MSLEGTQCLRKGSSVRSVRAYIFLSLSCIFLSCPSGFFPRGMSSLCLSLQTAIEILFPVLVHTGVNGSYEFHNVIPSLLTFLIQFASSEGIRSSIYVCDRRRWRSSRS